MTPLASSAEPRVLTVPAVGGPLRLENPEEGLALVCSGGDAVAVSCEQSYLAAGASYTPHLAPGVKLAGEVTVGPLPAAGARVSVVPKLLRSARFVTLPLRRDAKTAKLVREVSTDRAGRFRTPELAPGDYILEVVPPGGRLFHTDPFTVLRRETLLPKGPPRAGAEAVLDLGAIAFDEGVRVEVFVTGPGGEPLAGARVGALQGATPEASRFFQAEAGAAGKAVLSGLDPAQPVSLTCQTCGYLNIQQRFEAPPPVFSCALQPLARLEGTVRDGEGRPVAGATVSMKNATSRAASDGDGRFSFPGLIPGSYRIAVAAPGFRPERIAVELEAGESRTLPAIELLPGREIRGLVRDGQSGKPIAGASVTALEPPGAVSATSDEAGEITLTVGGDEPLRLQVAADGYPTKTVKLGPEPPADESSPWVIEMLEGGRIRVTVWDEEAEAPCQGCEVSIVQISGDGEWRTVRTGAAGDGLSEPLTPGLYSVTPSIVQSFGGVVTRRGGFDTKSLVVPSGVTKTVQFGDRTPSVRVRFRPGLPEGWSLSALAGRSVRMAERLDDGSFKLRKPPGGPITLSLSNGMGGSTRAGILAPDDDRKVVDLPLPQAELRGTLLRGEEPAGAQRVQVISAADAALGGSALTAADGSFAVPFLSPGIYTIFVEGRPLRSVSLAEGQTEELGPVPVEGR